MTFLQKRSTIYSIIIVSLIIAFLPVILSNNYLRQDDLIMWEIWPGMKMSQAVYFYYNVMFQLVRPLCMLSFFITDMISFTIHNAIYVRLASVLLICTMSILLYRWQLQTSANRLVAATFAICAFTLPPFQVFAATQNYFLILCALLMTFGAVFSWHMAFSRVGSKRMAFYWLGNILLFASFLDYPLSSMYAWTLLGIYYLNSLLTTDFAAKKKFVSYAGLTTVALMLFYFIFIKAVHKFLHINVDIKSAVIDTEHLISHVLGFFEVLSWHSNLWFWNESTTWKNPCLVTLSSLFIIALVQVNLLKEIKKPSQIIVNVSKNMVVIFVFLFVAYSPIIISSEAQNTYRFAIATMPLLLFVLFWSLSVITLFISNSFQGNKIVCLSIFIGVTFFGIAYANFMLGDGIVGPNEHDFQFMEQQVADNLLPLIRENKPVILHIIDCDAGKNLQLPKGVPRSFEYGMRSCQFQQVPLSIVTHILNRYGYASNYNRPNDVVWNTNEVVVKNIPWGSMIVNSVTDAHIEQLQDELKTDPILVTIDMRTEPAYQHFEFYKHLLGMRV